MINKIKLIAFTAVFGLLSTHAEEKGVFDYARQIAGGKEVKKIVFISDAGTHGGRGNHEFMAGALIIARALNAHYPNVHAVTHSTKGWPKDLSHADAIIVGLNHGGRAAKDEQIAEAVKRGAGYMAIHYGVEVNKGDQGNNYLQWMGGYFETLWSVNPWWTPDFKEFPVHPVTRGIKPFSLRDEWYYHMRFVDGMEGVTPILSELPPTNTIGGDGPRSGNPTIRKAVADGEKQHLAWAYVRPDGGRGFGFTGMHAHNNMGNDSFRTILINAAAWVSKLEIPEGGIPSPAMDANALDAVITDAKTAIQEGK
ncbi:MAG: ThuA domain-containing protein [Planctomycetota bacterium]|nr:ThuA domain-containing protein [Planctomycetota bacterium]MDA1140360.1 ThuA domain-containing protein [Planctomycetota bacterium]